MEENSDLNPKPLSRWVTIPAGILLMPITLLCVIGSALLILAPNVPPTLLTISLGSLFLFGSLWICCLSFRLVFTNPNSNKKLISPLGLRIIALVFASIPIISLSLGTFWENPIIHTIMTVSYIGIVFRLFGIAKNREQNA